MLDLTSLEDALSQLSQIAQRSQDESFMSQQDDITRNAIRSGVIKHFAIVYDLCWKFIQRWIRENRTPEDADNPRTRKDLFRLAAKNNLINDPEPWFVYGNARNLTAHTYNAKKADEVYEQAVKLVDDANYLLNKLKETND